MIKRKKTFSENFDELISIDKNSDIEKYEQITEEMTSQVITELESKKRLLKKNIIKIIIIEIFIISFAVVFIMGLFKDTKEHKYESKNLCSMLYGISITQYKNYKKQGDDSIMIIQVSENNSYIYKPFEYKYEYLKKQLQNSIGDSLCISSFQDNSGYNRVKRVYATRLNKELINYNEKLRVEKSEHDNQNKTMILLFIFSLLVGLVILKINYEQYKNMG